MPATAPLLHKAMLVQRAKALALYVLVLLVVAPICVLLAAKPAHVVSFTGDKLTPRVMTA